MLSILDESRNPSIKTLTRLARCYLALGNPLEALSTLQTALRLEPDNAGALGQLGIARTMHAHVKNVEDAMRNGDWAFAQTSLQQVTEIASVNRRTDSSHAGKKLRCFGITCQSYILNRWSVFNK